jgi:hypothetical protein
MVFAEIPWKRQEVFPWGPISMRITGEDPLSRGQPFRDLTSAVVLNAVKWYFVWARFLKFSVRKIASPGNP